MPDIDFSTIPPLIADNTAINSVLILCGALCVGVATTFIMAPRAAAAFRTLNPMKMFGTSTLRRQNSIGSILSTTSTAGLSLPTKLGHIRVLAIFVSAVMHVGQAINCIVYFVLLWKKPQWAHAPASFLADLITIVPGAPLVCMSMIYRIALVLVTHPQTRKRLLLVTNTLTFLVPFAFFAVVIGTIAIHWDADIVTWQGIAVYTPATGPIVLLLPLLAFSISIWSIRATLTQQAPTPSTATYWEPVFPGDSQKSPPAGADSKKLPAGSAGPSPEPGHTSLQQHSMIMSVATVDPALSTSHQGGLSESLKSTFLLLTVVQAIYWSAYLLLVIISPPIPMRVVSITVTLSSLSCATEAAFESILRRNQMQLKERAKSLQRRKMKRLKWSPKSALSIMGLRQQGPPAEEKRTVQATREM